MTPWYMLCVLYINVTIVCSFCITQNVYTSLCLGFTLRNTCGKHTHVTHTHVCICICTDIITVCVVDSWCLGFSFETNQKLHIESNLLTIVYHFNNVNNLCFSGYQQWRISVMA